jgi:predicted enzyme related to lactoylglutathione lyase
MVAFYSEAFDAHFDEVDVGGLRCWFGELPGGLLLKLVPIRDGVDFTGFPLHQPGFAVADITRVIECAVRHGGRVQDAVRQTAEGGTQAAIRDPDGNTIELYGST